MAANLLTDRARRARVRADYRDMVGAMAERDLEPLDPHRIASGRAEIADFMAALADLPQRQRTMFILYRLEGMSQDMIGAAFGISKSAVKKQIAGAMAFLMGRMRGRR
jgi:RNA polymerase sigma-70 factor (ECF subfamily)